jgi:hypothetical protein
VLVTKNPNHRPKLIVALQTHGCPHLLCRGRPWLQGVSRSKLEAPSSALKASIMPWLIVVRGLCPYMLYKSMSKYLLCLCIACVWSKCLMIWTCSLVHNMKHSSSNKRPKKLSTKHPPHPIMKKMLDVWNQCPLYGKVDEIPKVQRTHTHTHTHTPQHVLIPTTHVVCSSLIVGSKTTTTTTKSLLPSLLPFDWTRLKRNHPCCYCSMYIFSFFPISHHPRVIHPSFDTNGFHLLWMKS